MIGVNIVGVQQIIISDEAGQRVDNFLICFFKSVPKSRVYRLLRKGEVRVNKKRVAPDYRLCSGDIVRIPPVFLRETEKPAIPSNSLINLLKSRIIYEDDDLIVLNKPSGLAVHGGSTVALGLIEAMRQIGSNYVKLELAHRLDTETSGCLVLAKKKRVLRELHTLLREGKVTKIYLALTRGKWKKSERRVSLSLHKHFAEGGKHVVSVSAEGKEALTIFTPIAMNNEVSLVEANLMTGRTHQIRVHAAAQGHAIAGDDRYGDRAFNKVMRQNGLKRLFLHAKCIDFTLLSTGQRIKVEAPLDEELEQVLLESGVN